MLEFLLKIGKIHHMLSFLNHVTLMSIGMVYISIIVIGFLLMEQNMVEQIKTTYWEFKNSKNGFVLTDVKNVRIWGLQFINNGKAIKVESTSNNFITNWLDIDWIDVRCTKPLTYNGNFYPSTSIELINLNLSYSNTGIGDNVNDPNR